MIDFNTQVVVRDGKITVKADFIPQRDWYNICMFVAYRCAFQWYIKDNSEQWHRYEGGQFPVYYRGYWPASTAVSVEFTRNMDLATLAAPFECWLGYGESQEEMLAAGRMACVHTIMPTDIKPWTTPPKPGRYTIDVSWQQPGEDGNNGQTTGYSDGSQHLRLVQPAGWRDNYALACAGHELMHALGAMGNHE